jgi:hypothetical protein
MGCHQVHGNRQANAAAAAGGGVRLVDPVEAFPEEGLNLNASKKDLR